MPLVTGETLRAKLEREGQLPISDAVRPEQALGERAVYIYAFDAVLSRSHPHGCYQSIV